MVGKKKIKLTDEQMAEKVVPAKISDKEMQSLADDGMAKKIFNALVAVGEQYDRTVSGPMRTAILESIKKDPIRGISEGIKSIRGEDHASGEDIAGALGVPETVDLVPNFAANLVPSDPKIKFPIKKVLGFAAEVGVDLPYGTILKSLKAVPQLSRAEVLGAGSMKMIAADGTTPKLAKALGKGTKRTGTPTYGEIGMSIQGEGLIELIHDPLKFYEKLSGSKNITGAKRVGDITVPTGATRSKGVISKVTKQVDNLLSQVKLRITKQDMADDIRKRMLHKYYDAASGNLDPEDIRTMEEVIGQHFGRGGDAFVESAQTKSKLSKHADAELVKKANAESSLSPLEDLENILEQESISLNNLNEVKRNLGKSLRDNALYPSPEIKVARESRVKTDIYRELNNIIEENLQKLPDDVVKKYTKLNGASPVEHFGYLNDKSHFLLSIKEIMEKAPARDLKSPSFMEKVMHLAASGAFGAMGYSAFGSGGIAGGMALPFMFGQAGRKVGESFVRSFQAGRLRNLEKKVLEGVESPFKPILKGLRGASYTKVPYLNEDFQQGEDLVNVRFPRTSKGIMENADTFIASLAQRTNDPNIVEQVRQAVNDQNLLSRLMPQFVNQYPEMFEFDKYGRFDGKFTDPEKRRYANKEIRMDKSKNSFERSVIIDFINRENQLPDQM